MNNLQRCAIAFAVTGFLFTSTSRADVGWDWSFNGEVGGFVTDGNNSDPGVYTIVDFSVAASAVGGTLGSLLGGQYTASGFSTDPPYTFSWDGASVTAWFHTGANTFDWNVYEDQVNSNHFYFFGWADGNINDPTSAAYYDANTGTALSVGTVTVTPVPAPGAIFLLAGAGLAARRRRRSEPKTPLFLHASPR